MEKEAKASKKKMASEVALKPEDILYFTKTSTRGENDKANKVRENILVNVFAIPDAFYQDKIYGPLWEFIIKQFTTVLEKPPLTFTVKKMAGRGNNHDFQIIYTDPVTEEVVETKQVEFKYNTKSVEAAPQFLSLNIKSDIIEQSYAEWYYTRYLDRYLALDPEITATKPTLPEYMKHITNVSRSCHPLFAQMYDREETRKAEKAAIVNESIEAFLKLYGPNMLLEKLTEKFQNTQTYKDYLLFHRGTFRMVSSLVAEDFHLIKNDGLKNGNTIVVRSATYAFQLLLRWRNRKGILNPAWQISLKKE